MRTAILLVLLFGIPGPALAEPEIKGTASELVQYLASMPRTVAVTGEAEVRVPAQRAVLSLRVVTETRSLQDSLRSNQEIRARLAAALKRQGIPDDRIQASRFSSTPRYGLFGEKPKSYRVENMVRVMVQDEREFQNAAGTVDSWAEVQFGGVDFEYADREALRQQAISQACDNAAERARVYQEKLGLKLLPVGFGEGTVNQRSPEAGNYAKGYAGASAEPSRIREAEAAGGESLSSLGELIYTARITVEYRVESR